MSTGINNFPANEEHNPGGNEAFFFRPVDDVVEIPEAIAKLISNNVTFASGVTGFFSGYSTPESLQFSEKQINDNDLGPAFEVLVQGFYPCAHPDYDELFDTIAQYRHIVLVKDNNERQRLAGNLEKGLRFTASFTTGGKFGNLKGYEFAFTGIYKERQPYYGSVAALEPPDCPGVTVTINGSAFAEYAAGSNNNIEVVDGDDNAVGSEAGGKWVVPSPSLEDKLNIATACEIQNAMPNSAKRRAIFPSYKLRHFNTTLPSVSSFDYKNNLTGNETNFFTLPCSNFVGLSDADALAAGITKSTARFTNTKGGSVYDGSDGSVPNCMLDHLQQVPDGTRNCLMVYLIKPRTGFYTCTDAMGLADTDVFEGYSDWRLPDLQEAFNLNYVDTTSTIRLFNYPPINQFQDNVFGRVWWTRERVGNTGVTRFWAFDSNAGSIIQQNNTTSSNSTYFLVRKHTY